MGPFSLLMLVVDDMSRLISDLEEMLTCLVEELGYKLWALQLLGEGGSKTLRLFIDQPDYSGEIGIEDCTRVSREVAALLDVNDPISGHYTLEVSSPGVDRPLFTPLHFSRFIGEQADIKTYTKINNTHRHRGLIHNVDADGVELRLPDDTLMTVPHAEIRRAKLLPDFEKLLAGQPE